MSSIDTKFDLAILALKGKRYAEAEQLYTTIATEQNSPEAWVGLGFCKLNQLAEADNKRLLEELCLWLEKNIDSTLGMQELIEKTNLSSTDIQFLFERYKQTTPMTYIRVLREDSVKKAMYLDKMRITPIFIEKD